ncbi:uncharacterized protein LOC142165731 [Nicotiana tabacum]|uniref:Uncharacterized protein LOC142165731 n=1 Tax=Nicotiana tabacum TaxID=4097 RepID=A0AC58S5F7_TOBAC
MGSHGDNITSPSVPTNAGFTPFTLDPSHPFYVYPPDNPRSQLLPVPFNGHGFVLWKSSMLTSLYAKNKLGMLDGRIAQLLANSPFYSYWERYNDMVKSWIINSVSRGTTTRVMYFITAKEVWTDINERSLWDELNSSYIGSICSCGALPKFIEDQQLFQFLNGLNNSHSTVKSVIMLMNPLPPISKAYSLLQQDEIQRETQASILNFPNESACFFVSSTTPNRNFNQSINFNSKKNNSASYKYCKKPGHTMEKCCRLHCFPADFEFSKGKKSASCV